MTIDGNIKQVSLKENTPLYKWRKLELKAFMKALDYVTKGVEVRKREREKERERESSGVRRVGRAMSQLHREVLYL